MPKILILILSTVDPKYEVFKQACKNTWVKRAEEKSILSIFYEGNTANDSLVGNELRLATDDSLRGSGSKLVRALEFIENARIEYDYIFRTNLSSYIFIENFVSWAENINDENLYAGVAVQYNLNHRWPYRFMCRLAERMHPNNAIPFASGAGFWISRRNVLRVLSDKKINFRLIDDPMVGEVLHRHKVNVTPVSRIDLDGHSITYRPTPGSILDHMKDCYHVRCRSTDRIRDAARFYELNELLCPSDFDKMVIV